MNLWRGLGATNYAAQIQAAAPSYGEEHAHS
jgi:hypothetical protein